MIHVLATITVAAGARARVLDRFRRLVPYVRAEDGCIEYGAAVDIASGLGGQPPERPDVFVVVEKWRDLPALQAHLAAPHMAEYKSDVTDLVTDTVLQVLDPVHG